LHHVLSGAGHEVPQVYGTYSSLDAIPPFEQLPRNFVLKPTHGWSAAGVFLMRDGVDWFTKRRLSRDELIHAARAFAGPGQQAIAGPWIAEELLVDVDDPARPAPDYKFYCFGPKMVALQVTRRNSLRDTENPNWFFDQDWRHLPFRLKWNLYPERAPLAKPPFFDDMLAMVSDVGRRLDIFIRIDMYATDRGPVFGEFTGYPGSGMNFTPRVNAWLGSHWTTRDGGPAMQKAN
jgi:hypothetical protein